MITLQQVSLARGAKVLLNKASVSLYEKQKVGLIGHNGCGKSSLFALLLGKLNADDGNCFVKSQLRISYLSQQLPESDTSALDFVLAGDTEYMGIMQRLHEAQTTHCDEEILNCHELLEQTGGYGKPALAAAIMHGLGFKTDEQLKAVNSFSGGWRMRLSLARCLMQPAELYLLDEPTNHLDMEAIFWLEKWLKQSPASIILISHDRDFLDAFVTDIVHIDNQQLKLYSGNYSRFEQTRAAQLTLQQQLYEKQQNKIAHMMAFVNRFKAKASKAKQARSRLNAIARMEVVAQAQFDSPFSFSFLPANTVGNPLIACDQMSVGYTADKPILKNVNLNLNNGDRIALLGPNGQGKSTFIKALTGLLSPISGTISHAQNLKIGYYAQHQLEELDPALSPLQTLQLLSPESREQNVRDFLGGFNFTGDMAMSPITHFSGGEKARLALAKLVWQKPNLLLLDEPTNHLDLAMRSAIEIALQSFEGAIILISHDRHLLKTTVNDFYLVYNQQLRYFEGDLDEYHLWLASAASITKNAINDNDQNYRERKQLQNRLKKLEELINTHHREAQKLEEKLADGQIYEKGQEEKLAALITKRNNVRSLLLQIEEEWLDISSSLEDKA